MMSVSLKGSLKCGLPRFIWMLLGVVCLALPARADDAAVQGVGGAMEAMQEHPSVVMKSELVEARVTPKGADVRCVFVFRNDGPAAKVKMGFPEYGWGDIDIEHPRGFRSFRSWVDGEPVATAIEGFRADRDRGWKRWRTKLVPFSAGQTRRVEVRYEDGIGEMSDGSNFFTYALRTGASWKGKIGHAKVVVRFAGMKGCSTADGGILEGYKVVRGWEHFEPKEDVFVPFFPPASPLFLNGRRLDYDLSAAPLPVGCSDLLVPARWLVEHIGGALTWDPESAAAILKRDPATILLTTDGPPNAEGTRVYARLWHSRVVVSVAEVLRALGGSAHFEQRPPKVVAALRPQPDKHQGAGAPGVN